MQFSARIFGIASIRCNRQRNEDLEWKDSLVRFNRNQFLIPSDGDKFLYQNQMLIKESNRNSFCDEALIPISHA